MTNLGGLGLIEALAVRRADLTDVESIASVHVAGWRMTYKDILPRCVLDRMTPADCQTRWEQLFAVEAHSVFVAQLSGVTVGFCSTAPCRDEDASRRTAELRAIYVDPRHLRCGVGSALLRASVKELRGRAYTELVLWVAQNNQRAQAFYASMGFRRDGSTKRLVFGGHTLYERRLVVDLESARRADWR